MTRTAQRFTKGDHVKLKRDLEVFRFSDQFIPAGTYGVIVEVWDARIVYVVFQGFSYRNTVFTDGLAHVSPLELLALQAL